MVGKKKLLSASILIVDCIVYHILEYICHLKFKWRLCESLGDCQIVIFLSLFLSKYFFLIFGQYIEMTKFWNNTLNNHIRLKFMSLCRSMWINKITIWIHYKKNEAAYTYKRIDAWKVQLPTTQFKKKTNANW